MEINFLVEYCSFLTGCFLKPQHHQTPAFRLQELQLLFCVPCYVLIVLAVAFSLNLSFLLTFILEATDLLVRKVIPGVGATGADRREGRVCMDMQNRLVAAKREGSGSVG